MFKFILSFLIIGICIASGILFWYRPDFLLWLSPGNTSELSVPVEYKSGALALEVNNAQIVSKDEYNLTFPLSGTVDEVFAQEGTVTDVGTKLVKLETRELELELKKNEALLAEAEANLAKLRKGTRLEEIAVYVDKKNSSETTLKNQKQAAIDTAYDAFIQSDDAIHNKTDPLFTNPNTAPQLTFTPSDSGLENDIESERLSLESKLNDWKNSAKDMKTSGDIQKYINTARNNLGDVTSYLDKIALAVNALVAGSITQNTIDSWKVSTIAARTAVSTATSNVGTAEASFNGARKDLSVAESELDLKVAGTQSDDVIAAVNAAEVAKNQMEVVKEHMRQSILTAPETGLTIEKIYPKKGEYVQSGMPVAIVSQSTLEIQVDVPEEDISSVSIGNTATLTLSALPREKISGTVSSIERKEIEKEGSIYFRFHISLQSEWEKNERLRPGMTGNILIFGTNIGKALRIPQSALYTRDGVIYVKVIRPSKKIEEVGVKVGAEGEGYAQIMAGLGAGDKVILKP